MPNSQINLAQTTELCGAILTASGNFNEENFASSAHDYIFSRYNINIPASVSFTSVYNDSGTINLALPYYSKVGTMGSRVVSEDELVDASGGELIFILLPAAAIGIAYEYTDGFTAGK